MSKITDAIKEKPFASPAAATLIEGEVGKNMLEREYADGQRGRLPASQASMNDGIGKREMSKRKMAAILAVMDGDMMAAEIAKRLKISPSSAGNHLRALVNLGKVEKAGRANNDVYGPIIWRKVAA